jgi:hypothetical protein
VRQALNENPVIQAAVLGVLAIVVGFMLITRVFAGEEQAAAPPPTTPTTSASTAGAGSTASEPAAPAIEPTAPPSEPTAPTSSSTAGTAAAAASAQPGRFVAGPGLPQKVVTAYAKGKAIALYVYRRKGVDDAFGRFNFVLVRALRNANLESEVAMFTTNAHHIARYSRIAEGVDVSRVPALVVIKPRKLTGDRPLATVSYGYRGPESVVQAVKDSLYKGRQNVPYYPE